MIAKKLKIEIDGTKNYKIAIFLDYLNIEIPVSKSGKDQHFNYAYIEKFVSSFGKVVFSKAYGPWSFYRKAAECLKTYNVDLFNTRINTDYRHCKDITDTQMTSDIIETLYNYHVINLYIIITGDLHLKPAIEKIIGAGEKKVIIISDKFSINKKLKDIADKFLTYQDLIKIYNL